MEYGAAAAAAAATAAASAAASAAAAAAGFDGKRCETAGAAATNSFHRLLFVD